LNINKNKLLKKIINFKQNIFINKRKKMTKDDQSITINFFDINGEYREDAIVDLKQNFLLLDSPIRIIEQYINDNFLQDLQKKTEDQFVVQYKFSYEIDKNVFIPINCDVINNFSISHQGTLDSNGYIVFCNLENENTFVLLEKIVDYIRECCSINIKTYIIGVFKDNIDEEKSYIKMRDFLSGLDFEFDYYEMYLGDKETFKIIKKEYENSEIMEDVFNSVFKEIYEEGKGPRFSKGTNVKDGIEAKSMAKCIIF
jgi:hypothetical protein